MSNQLNSEAQKLFANFTEYNKTYINIVLQEKDAPFNLDFMTFRRQFIDYIGSIFYEAQTEDTLD